MRLMHERMYQSYLMQRRTGIYEKSGTMKKCSPIINLTCVCSDRHVFATLSAAVALIIPLVVRYVTYNLVYREPAEILHQAAYIAIDCLCWWRLTVTVNSTFVITDM